MRQHVRNRLTTSLDILRMDTPSYFCQLNFTRIRQPLHGCPSRGDGGMHPQIYLKTPKNLLKLHITPPMLRVDGQPLTSLPPPGPEVVIPALRGPHLPAQRTGTTWYPRDGTIQAVRPGPPHVPSLQREPQKRYAPRPHQDPTQG